MSLTFNFSSTIHFRISILLERSTNMKFSCGTSFAFLILFLFAIQSVHVYAGSFHKDVQIHWGDGRGKVRDRDGKLLSLSLDKSSGSGFQSHQEFLYGRAEVQMKLVPGNSAGTVTTFYLKSPGTTWDEIDFEFLGNISGHPYTLHTNVYTKGSGDKEQQFHLWFDPTVNFHTYCITWNPQRIIFTVDGIPIREFKNSASKGVPFPTSQPMRLYASLWEAEHWATRGGLEKTDWSKAPFTAFYRNYNVDGCIWANGKSSCPANSPWFTQQLDSNGQTRMKGVQSKYMVYNYCTDQRRFPQGVPPECS